VTRRILILAAHFFKAVLFSLAGILYVIVSLAYWAVFFPPGQPTPDMENYTILIGVFGMALAFLATLSTADKANQLENYPVLVRLPSRIEYLTAVMLSAFAFTVVLQALMAGLALIRGPEVGLRTLLEIPPMWLAIDIVAITLAIHATDLVTVGWSRVLIFGLLALLLVFQQVGGGEGSWLAERLNSLSAILVRLGFADVAGWVDSASFSLQGFNLSSLNTISSAVFWPFRSLVDAVFSGFFTPIQALAPAILLLYATMLFLLAANFFAGKDLDFAE
jgi:hypothetical protein